MDKVKIYVSFNIVEGNHTEVEETKSFESYRKCFDFVSSVLLPLGFLASVEEFEKNEEKKEKESYKSFCKQRRHKTVNAYKPS